MDKKFQLQRSAVKSGNEWIFGTYYKPSKVAWSCNFIDWLEIKSSTRCIKFLWKQTLTKIDNFSLHLLLGLQWATGPGRDRIPDGSLKTWYRREHIKTPSRYKLESALAGQSAVSADSISHYFTAEWNSRKGLFLYFKKISWLFSIHKLRRHLLQRKFKIR